MNCRYVTAVQRARMLHSCASIPKRQLHRFERHATVNAADSATSDDSDVGSLVDDSSLTANDVENGVSAEAGDQTDLSKRTITITTGSLFTSKSIDDIPAGHYGH